MIVAHLDLDAFFAAVEELEDPELRPQPLVVGGDPHGRGVVATANYEARTFGIHSAMSCAEALRRCPHAVFIRPRHPVYREYSQHVWETVRGVVPTLERTGLDEGYLDVGEVAEDFLTARKVAEAVQTSVRAATSLTCSLGVSTSKVVAMIASDYRKTDGANGLEEGAQQRLLDPQPLDLAARGHRRRRADRGAGVRPARPCAHRPARCAAPRRRRRLGPRQPPAARARLIHRSGDARRRRGFRLAPR